MKAVRANTLYMGIPDKVLNNVYLIWSEDRIIDITNEKPKNVEEVYEYDYAVVTPAFIDAHSHIGMERAGENPSEEETNERMDTILPHLDALYSIYMDDKSFRESIEFGVLYSCVMPGSGNVIGGKCVVIRNYAKDVEEAFIKYAGIKAALGYNPRSTINWKGSRPYTRMGVIGLLRKYLIKAKDSLILVEKGKRDLEEIEPEIRLLFPIIKGEETLRVHVHKNDDIVALIRLKREFNLKVTIEHACDVNDRSIFERIKREEIPITYGPIDSFSYKTELKHEYWRNIKLLIDVKPFFGLMSDHPVILQRNLYLQLRFFRRFGMNKSECISLITYNNAKILGIDNVLGTLEPSKWASFIVWNGDPFSLESYPVLVIAEGMKIFEE
ncbi:MAG: imidazolonepropionase [Thermoprotei archaeon ex4572_64]|nr:MAG: imidazolonepropionase [Thermoprotei archaeon ex4572_64]